MPGGRQFCRSHLSELSKPSCSGKDRGGASRVCFRAGPIRPARTSIGSYDMKFTTSTTLAALLVATLGLGATASAASAQDRSGARPDAPRHHQMLRHHGDHRQGGRHVKFHRSGGILALTCNPRGGDRLEHSLLSLSHRLDPTDTQQPLFEAFSDAAIEAQTSFAEACAAARTASGSDERPNLVERLESRIELGNAHTEAMSAVLPALQAFHDSLSEEQKAALEPRRGKSARQFRLRGERGERSERGEQGERTVPSAPNAPVAPRFDG
jgi:hypothetical protein